MIIPDKSAAARRLTDKYILLMLLVFPLFTGFSGYSSITAAKFVFFTAATLLWLILCLAAALPGMLRSRPRMRLSPTQAAVAVFAGASVLSWLCSGHIAESFFGAGRYDGLFTTLLCCAVFFGVSNFARFRARYLVALGLSCALCCIVAVLQLCGLDALGLFPGALDYYDAGTQYSGVYLGTIGNMNILSAFLCLCIPLFVFSYVRCGGKYAFLLLPATLGIFIIAEAGASGGAIALIVCAIIAAPVVLSDMEKVRRGLFSAAAAALALFFSLSFSGTKANGTISLTFAPDMYAYLGLLFAAVFVIIGLLAGICGFKPSEKTLRRLFAALACCAAAAGLAAIYFYPGSSGTLYELSRILHLDIRDEFGSNRILIWREVLELFPERPLLGGGPGTLSLRLDIDFSRYVAETGKTLTAHVDNAHNTYLGLLADTGILGLGAYLAAMVCSAIALLRRRQTAAACIGCALVCAWTEAFFGLGLCLTTPLLWIFWGLFEHTSPETEDVDTMACK